LACILLSVLPGKTPFDNFTVAKLEFLGRWQEIEELGLLMLVYPLESGPNKFHAQL
jgi:hypothetical protein